MIGYLIALVPFYILIYVPLTQWIKGSTPASRNQQVAGLNSSFIADNEPLICPSHSFNSYILSHEPLIIYIENFISADESQHILTISEDNYFTSTVTTGSDTSIQTSIRNSSVALLDRDEVVRCIEHRARAFQGWRPDLHIERLRAQRYAVGGHYKHHFDWSGGRRDADRVSTFMVYVDAECEGGGTEFPRLRLPDGLSTSRWCEFLECEEEAGDESGGDGRRSKKMGITFKPIKGNAIFWENLGADGRGYEETYHAGLPVVAGTKVGLNIWSWGPARGLY